MEYKKFGNTLIVRLDRGEEVVDRLLELARREGPDLILLSIRLNPGVLQAPGSGPRGSERWGWLQTSFCRPGRRWSNPGSRRPR